jgi:hypothetical protein
MLLAPLLLVSSSHPLYYEEGLLTSELEMARRDALAVAAPVSSASVAATVTAAGSALGTTTVCASATVTACATATAT